MTNEIYFRESGSHLEYDPADGLRLFCNGKVVFEGSYGELVSLITKSLSRELSSKKNPREIIDQRLKGNLQKRLLNI